MKKIISFISASTIFLSVSPIAIAAPTLTAPSNLMATAVSTSQINLSWQDNSCNETGFKIERGLDGQNFSEIATVGTNTISYSNTGLSDNTTYHYRVRAYKAQGNKTQYSGYSNMANATTFNPAPVAPSNLTAIAGQSATSSAPFIDLNWTNNSTNESGFAIERSTDGINFSYLTHIWLPNTTIFRDNSVFSGTTYYYRVKAFVFLNFQMYYSEHSNIASATAL